MTASTSPYNDEISLAELIAKIRVFIQAMWEERGLFLRLMGTAAAIGLFVALGSGEEFSAKTRVLPYRSNAGGAQGLSGLAGLAGIQLRPFALVMPL